MTQVVFSNFEKKFFGRVRFKNAASVFLKKNLVKKKYIFRKRETFLF